MMRPNNTSDVKPAQDVPASHPSSSTNSKHSSTALTAPKTAPHSQNGGERTQQKGRFCSLCLKLAPIRWYLAGGLAPTDTGIRRRLAETNTDEIDLTVEAGGRDETAKSVTGALKANRVEV